MDLATIIQKVRDLVAAARAGNYLVAIGLVLELIKEISGALPSPTPGIRMASAPETAAFAACEAKSADDLCTDLDSFCTQHAPATAALKAAPTGPVITILLPILLALLKKWLGF